jgi:hypothetical protein
MRMESRASRRYIKPILISILFHLALFFLASHHIIKVRVEYPNNHTNTPIINARLVYKTMSSKPDFMKLQIPEVQKVKNEEIKIQSLKTISTATEKELISKRNSTTDLEKSNHNQQVESDVNEPEPATPINIAELNLASKKYLSKWQDSISMNQRFPNGSSSIVATKHKAVAVPQFGNSIDNTGTMGAPRISKVICDNALNTAVVVMSGLFGGTVRCQPTPDLREFLNDRNKQNNSK